MKSTDEILAILNEPSGASARVWGWEDSEEPAIQDLEQIERRLAGEWRHGTSHLLILRASNGDFIGITYRSQKDEGVVEAGKWRRYTRRVTETFEYEPC